MGTWAIIQKGVVTSAVMWDGPDSDSGWKPPKGSTAVEFFEDAPAQIGWKYEDGKFIEPPPDELKPPSAEEAEAYRRLEKDRLLREASIAMTPSFMALQLGNATDEETQTAKAWQKYYRDLKAVDVSDDALVWPTPPTAE